jgi:endonuclease YncB( thermonuclease family)
MDLDLGPSMTAKTYLSVLLLTVLNAQPVYPHGGGLDSSGCHNNKKTGDRHCHRSKTRSSTKSDGLISGPVTLLSVGDGDTVRVAGKSGAKVTIRLACIDAPETSQGSSGRWSTKTLKGILQGKSISLKPQIKDRYGRTVAEIFVGTTNINLQMVREGAAFAYRKYLKQCDQDAYLNAESTAQQNRKGVWGPYQTQLPWEYRRSRSNKQ